MRVEIRPSHERRSARSSESAKLAWWSFKPAAACLTSKCSVREERCFDLGFGSEHRFFALQHRIPARRHSNGSQRHSPLEHSLTFFILPHPPHIDIMIARAAIRTALRANKAPSALSQLGARRGYAEAVSDKLKLSFILPHEVRISRPVANKSGC